MRSNTEDEIGGYVHPEFQSSAWFENLFNSRINSLLPYKDPQSEVLLFGSDQRGIVPDKLTSSILWKVGNRYEVLVSDTKESGYRELDHNKILQEFQISFDMDRTFMALLIQSRTSLCIIVNNLNFLMKGNLPVLQDTLKRYGISTAFNVMPGIQSGGYKIDPNPKNTIDLEKFDQLIFNDWSTQVAATYSLTIFEWLRFKLNGELPNKKSEKMQLA